MTTRLQIAEWIQKHGINSLPYKVQYFIEKGLYCCDVYRYFDDLFEFEEQQRKASEFRQSLYKDFKVNANQPAKDIENTDLCEECSRFYNANIHNQKYCSPECTRRAKLKGNHIRNTDGRYRSYQRNYYLQHKEEYLSRSKKQAEKRKRSI